MKKLILLVVVIATLQVTAQEKGKTFMKDLSVEQIATLKSKKMMLHLDLTDRQYNEVYQLNLELAKDRKVNEKERLSKEERENLSSKERYDRQIIKLDRQIEVKRKFAKILTAEQLEKYSKMKMHEKSKMKKKIMKHRKSEGFKARRR
jgi:hypothetical protein